MINQKRRTKLNQKEINVIEKWSKNKPIIEKKVSAKIIQIRFNKLKKIKKNKWKKLYLYQQQTEF